jgi:two-component system repressor protein LuxO
MLESENYPLIVILDDEHEILKSIKRCLMRVDVKIEAFTSPRLALEFIKNNEPKLIISDQRMPDIVGLEVLKSVKETWPNTKRVMLSAFQDFDLVLDGFNHGIIDKYMSKPWKNVELQYLVEGVCNHNTVSSVGGKLSTPFIGEHALMIALFENITKAAGANVPIFIHGETGTGKELVANACHELGCKKSGEFVAVNCANFTEQLVESQLFGHKKGAFTGAVTDKKGVFEYANGGTIFLDEITTLPLNLQSKLLRVIQERSFSPLGSLETQSFDAQIVSASSTSLSEAVANGEFRQDLYYRLGVIPIKIPPLRDREGDILNLANHFLNKFSKDYQKQFLHFDEQSIAFLLSYTWPGNVRQLENVIHGLCVLNDGIKVELTMIKSLIEDTITSDIAVQHTDIRASQNNVESDIADLSISPLHQLEKEAIERALECCNGNVNQAAALLEVNPSTLYRKIKSWG